MHFRPRIFFAQLRIIHCLFLQTCLPPFITFNLLRHREDPVFPVMYEAMIDLLVILFGRVLKPEVVARTTSSNLCRPGFKRGQSVG